MIHEGNRYGAAQLHDAQLAVQMEFVELADFGPFAMRKWAACSFCLPLSAWACLLGAALRLQGDPTSARPRLHQPGPRASGASGGNPSRAAPAPPPRRRRSMFHEIGGLDEGLSEPGQCGIWSDWEVCMRTWLAGYQVVHMAAPRNGDGTPGGTHRNVGVGGRRGCCCCGRGGGWSRRRLVAEVAPAARVSAAAPARARRLPCCRGMAAPRCACLADR